jgi:hypothetical protein
MRLDVVTRRQFDFKGFSRGHRRYFARFPEVMLLLKLGGVDGLWACGLCICPIFWLL